MKALIRYIRIKLRYILFAVCCFAIFFVMFYLYELPTEAFFYALMLCAILLVILFITGFLKYKNNIEKLADIMENIEYGANELPIPEEPEHREYLNAVTKLASELKKVKNEESKSIREMNDYYTLWVHQIKTPIAAMNLLIQKNEDSEMAEQLFRIEQYVDMALTYIRTDKNASDYVFESVSIDEVVRSALRKYAKSFIRKKLTLNYDGTKLNVVSDAKWLGFVTEQILSNSLKYTNHGSVTVKTEDNRLIISDTGIGISGEDLPRVFEKGYTGYNGRNYNKSTGIGLFLSKKIITALGHKIDISSEIMKGTTVTVTFSEKETGYE